MKKSPSTTKVRQVAVEEKHRGKGLGRVLMTGIEKASYLSGFKEIELHARDVAIAFYQNLEYEVEGDEFLEVGIPHYKMRKSLS